MAEKLYYSMGEVAEMFDVNPSLIRHWESQFSVLRPKRNKKGNRLFTPQDVENLKRIYHLVKERGMTLDGASRALKGKGLSEVARDMELLERLQAIRAQLVEVRNELKEPEVGAIVVDGAEAGSESETPVSGSGPDSPVTVAAVGDAAENAVENASGGVSGDADVSGSADATGPVAAAPGPEQPKVRRPRRKKEEAEHKELFAFYEQSLF